jgi:hypothetical protein
MQNYIHLNIKKSLTIKAGNVAETKPMHTFSADGCNRINDNNEQKPLEATELFTFFTADIIKEGLVFTR